MPTTPLLPQIWQRCVHIVTTLCKFDTFPGLAHLLTILTANVDKVNVQ